MRREQAEIGLCQRFVHVSCTWPWFGPRVAALRYVTYFRFVETPYLYLIGQEKAAQNKRILKATQEGAARI